MSKLSVDMFLELFFRMNPNAVLPEYADKDFPVSLSVWKKIEIVNRSDETSEFRARLVSHICDIVARENDLFIGRCPVYPIPRVVVSPFCSVDELLFGVNLNKNSNVVCDVGADIGYSDSPILIDIEAPIYYFMRSCANFLNLCQLECLIGDLVRVFTQVICFNTLPVSIKSKIISNLAFIVTFLRLNYGYPAKNDGDD